MSVLVNVDSCDMITKVERPYINIKDFSKEGYIYQPANRYILSLGVSIYTPVRRHDLKRFKAFEKFVNLLFGPAEPILPFPSVVYVEAGVIGHFLHDKLACYAYPIKCVGFGLHLTSCEEGYKIIEVVEDSPAYKAGLEKEDVIVAIASEHEQHQLQKMSCFTLKRLLQNTENVMITLLNKDTSVVLHQEPIRFILRLFSK